MANEVTYWNLANSNLAVGPKFDRVRGQSDEGVTITPLYDEGGIMTGNQGDSMLWSKTLAGYDITVSVLPASRAIKTLLLASQGGPAPLKFVNGEYDIFGVYTIKNRGEVSSVGGNPRSIVLSVALIKDSIEAPGVVVQKGS